MYIDVDCSDVKFYMSASRIFQDILKAEDDYCQNKDGLCMQTRSLPSKYTLPIPTNRTQNPEEALQGSLLLFFTMNKTDFHPITPPDIIPSMDPWIHLKEGFCRSVEPFSEVFDIMPKQMEEVDPDDPINRPQTCQK